MMVGDKFREYLKSLKTENAGRRDYDILFGFKPKPEGNGGTVDLKKIYAGFSNTMEDDIMSRYCNVADDVVTEVEPVAMEVEDVPEDQGDGEIARWCAVLESSDKSDIQGIFTLTDSQFEKVLAISTVNLQILERMMFHAHSNLQSISASKIDTLAYLGLLPKMLEGSPLRSVFPIFQKCIAINPKVVICRILLPMYQRKVTIPRPLLNGIDKQELLSLTLSWMCEETIDLNQIFISTLSILFEGQKKLEDCLYDNLIKLLDQSFRIKPDDKTIAFFLRSFLSSFGSTMKEDHLRKLQRVNECNQTDLKQSVQTLIEKNLSILS